MTLDFRKDMNTSPSNPEGDVFTNTHGFFDKAEETINSLNSQDTYKSYGDNLTEFLDAGGKLKEYNPYINDADIYALKAKNQSGWEQAFNSFVMQGAVGIGVLGTIAAFGDLYDFIRGATAESIAKDALDAMDDNGEFSHKSQYMYRNALSEWAHDKQNDINKQFQNYFEDTKEYNIFNGGLTAPSWWANNAASVWSFVPFMIPSGTVVKGLTLIPKLAKGVNTASKAYKIASELSKVNKAATAVKEVSAAEKAVARTNAYLSKAAEGLTSTERAAAKALQIDKLAKAQAEIANGASLGGQKFQQIVHSVLGTYLANNMFARDIAYQQEEALLEAFKDDATFNKVIEDNPSLREFANDKEGAARVIANRAATRNWEWNILTAYPMYGQIGALNNWWKRGANQGVTRALNKEMRLAKESLLGATEREAAAKFNESLKGKVYNFLRDTPWKNGDLLTSARDAAIGNVINVYAEKKAADVVNASNVLNKEGESDAYWWGRAVDAGFWGVVGGVYSNIFMSGVGRLMPDTQAKVDEANRAIDIKTWYSRIQKYKDTIKEYEDNLSPYYELDENGQRKKNPNHKEGDDLDPFIRRPFLDDAEKIATMKAEYDNMIAGMALNSLLIGNYDLLKAFMEDETIKKAVVGENNYQKAEYDEVYKGASKIFDNIQSTYEKHLKRAIDLGLNPYIAQTIASANTERAYGVDAISAQIDLFNRRINQIIDNHKEDAGFNYEEFETEKQAYITRILTTKLRQLYGRLNFLKDKKGIDYDLMREQTQQEINRILKNNYYNISLSDATLYEARRTNVFSEDGNPIYDNVNGKLTARVDTSLADEYIESKKGDLSDVEFAGLRANYEVDYDHIRQNAENFTKKYSDVVGILSSSIDLETQKHTLGASILHDDESIIKAAMITWTMLDNEAKAQFNLAKSNIKDLMIKYGYDEIYNVLAEHEQIKDGEHVPSTIEGITDEDLEKLNSSKFMLGLNTKAYKEFIFEVQTFKNNLLQAKQNEDLKAQQRKLTGYSVDEVAKINSDYNKYLDEVKKLDEEKNKKLKELDDKLNNKNITKDEYDSQKATIDSEYNSKIDTLNNQYAKERKAYEDYQDARETLDLYKGESGYIDYDVVNDNPKLTKDAKIIYREEDKQYKATAKKIYKDKSGNEVVDIICPSGKVDTILKSNVTKILPKKGTSTPQKKSSGTTTTPTEKSGTEGQESGSNGGSEDSSTGGQASLKIGQKIITDSYGEGIIKDIDDSDPNQIEYLVEIPGRKGLVRAGTGEFELIEEPEIITEFSDAEVTANEEIGKATATLFDELTKATDKEAVLQRIVDDIKQDPHGFSQDEWNAAVDEAMKPIVDLMKYSSVGDFMVADAIANGHNTFAIAKPLVTAFNNLVYDYLNTVLGITEINNDNIVVNALELLKFIDSKVHNPELSKKYSDVIANCANHNNEKFLEDLANNHIIIDTTMLSEIADEDLGKAISDPNYNIFRTKEKVSLDEWLGGDFTLPITIKNGDSFTVGYDDNSKSVVFKELNGKFVGRLHLPAISDNNGAFIFPTDGFETDLLSNGQNIDSEVIDAIGNIFSNIGNKHRTMIGLLQQFMAVPASDKKLSDSKVANIVAAYMKERDTNTAQEYSVLRNHQIKDISYSNEQIAYRQLLYLNKLFSYANGNQLNNWKQKLFDTATMLTQIANGNANDYSATVLGVNEGRLFITEDRGVSTERLANYKTAEQRNGQPNPYRLGVCSDIGNVLVSGNNPITFRYATRGNTFVVLPTQGNGFVPLVHAYGAKIPNLKPGSVGRKIVDDVKKGIKDRIIEFLENSINENDFESSKAFKELENFIKKAFWHKGATGDRTAFSLFRGNAEKKFNLTAKAEDDAIVIAIDEKLITIKKKNEHGHYRQTLAAKANNQDGFQSIGVENIDDELNGIDEGKSLDYFIDAIFDDAQFDININFVNNDGRKSVTFNDNSFGIFDDNGKFVINIPQLDGKNKTYEFDSYNDFMLDNDLVEVTVGKFGEKGQERNFVRTEKEAASNNLNFVQNFHEPSVYIELKQKQNQSPRRGTSENEASPTEKLSRNGEPILYDKVMDITESDSKTKGADIAKLLIPNLETIVEGIKLFPEKVVFDATLSENASYNPNTDTVSLGIPIIQNLKDENKNTTDYDYEKKWVVKKLLHERLHQIINNMNADSKEKTIESAKEVFEEYEKLLDNPTDDFKNAVKKVIAKDKYKNIGLTVDIFIEKSKGFKFEDALHTTEESRLEDFIIESFTNEDLAYILNEVKTDTSNLDKSESLWTKLVRWIASNILGIDINENSLLEKELNSLPKILDFSDKNAIFAENVESNVPKRRARRQINISNITYSSIDDFNVVPSKDDFVNSFDISERKLISAAIDSGLLNFKCK